MGKGVVDETAPAVARQRRAVRRRLRPPRHRRRRLHHQRRPRRDREAAVLHARGPAHGHPRQLRRRRGRRGVLPADRGDRRHRQRGLAADRGAVAAGALGLRLLRPRARSAAGATWRERSDDDRFPMVPQRLVADVARGARAATTSSASTTACTSCGSRATTAAASRTRCCSTTRWRRWAPACPRRSPRASSTRTARCVAVCGDGGFMMNSQELETAVRLGHRSDGARAARRRLRHDQVEAGHEDYPELRHGPRQSGFREATPRATAHAGIARRPRRSSLPLLRRALDTPGVDLIDVPIDYGDDDRILNEDIPRLSAAVR